MMENENKKKTKHFTLTNLICTLLIAALAMLALSEYAFMNKDSIYKQLAEEKAATSTADSATASALPSELTTVGSTLILVNKTYSLPSTYVPSDLETPYLNSSSDVIQLSSVAAEQAKAMKAAASEAGITLIVSSGYVSYADQEELYNAMVKLVGEGKASTAVEKAGCSENQTGLAINFTNDASQATPTKDFADTDAGKWLYANAHTYGFILRYPSGKESITGYDYMPWHYRYVGTDVANAMYAISPDETFEEYYNLNS